MKGIALYGNQRQEEYLKEIGIFMRRLEDAGFNIYIQRSFGTYLESKGVRVTARPVDRFPSDSVETLVSIGGDGTFLHAARWVRGCPVPILGVNTGHLGYLAGFSFNDMDQLMEVLTEGTGRVEPRMALKLESPHLPSGFWPYALNEVAILKSESASMVTVHTEVNGRYLADYLADGLIIATPTGSTAYNLSAGGPILEPMVSNMVISPIAPHSLTMRPLVIGGDAEITLSVQCAAHKCRISLDGRPFSIVCDGEAECDTPRLRITKAPFTVNILRTPDSDFSALLRSKLLWSLR